MIKTEHKNLMFVNISSQKAFGVRRTKAVADLINALEKFEKSKNKKNKVLAHLNAWEGTWASGGKDFSAMISVFVNGAIGDKQGYCVRISSGDIVNSLSETNRPPVDGELHKTEVLDKCVNDLEKVVLSLI